MEIAPSLTNWEERLGTDIAPQFADAYHSNNNTLALPEYFYRTKLHKGYKDRIAILNFVSSNHPNSIVRTKACIILSRTSNGLHSTETVYEWSINILRELIARDWDNINHDITPRWCISILNCFAEHGDHNERVVANSIAMMFNVLLYGSENETTYKADDTFINSMLRINLSLTAEVKSVTLAILNLISSENYKLNGFKNIASVWQMIIQEDLRNIEQVQNLITTYINDDATNNLQRYWR